jgi:nucleotide-binding universal stress UspA family protein
MISAAGRQRTRAYNHLLIATDGSDLAQRGVDQGLLLAKRLNAKVTFVAVSADHGNYGAKVAGEAHFVAPRWVPPWGAAAAAILIAAEFFR